jgi:O-antigen/teichoic acid export membrane protein
VRREPGPLAVPRRAGVARNASMLTLATVTARLSMFAVGIVLARALGASEYGRYSLALALGVVLQPVADFGNTRYVVRETARERAGTEAALGILARAKLAGLLAVYLVTLAVAWVAVSDRELFAVLAVMVLAALVDGWSLFAYGYFQGREAMGFEARATAAAALVRSAGAIALALVFRELGPVVAWVLLVAIAQAAAATRMMWRAVGPRPPRAASVDWRSVASMGVIAIFVMTYLRVDSVLIGWLVDERAVGLYAAAYTLMLGVQIVPGMLSTALQPVLARTYAGDPAAFERTWQLGVRSLMLITVPAALGFCLLAGPVIERCFGAGFGRSADVLRVIIWICPLVGASLAAQAVLRAARRERTLSWVSGVCAAVNVGLNLWAIPTYGIMGAAVVTVVTEAVNVVLLLWLVLGARLVGVPRLPTLRLLAAAGGLTAAALLLADAPVELAVLAAAVAYLGILIATGVLRGEELAAVRRLVRR